MTPRFGIDTSILVRLLTGKPEQVYAHCVSALQDLIAEQGAQILASNTVIGEAYVAVQHHYGVSKDDARTGMLKVLRSGLVSPLNGTSVFTAIENRSGAGLFDRLIADALSARPNGDADAGQKDVGSAHGTVTRHHPCLFHTVTEEIRRWGSSPSLAQRSRQEGSA